MEFESDADRRKLDPIVAAFEQFCVGTVNVTYERYVFNRRQQENGERFDVFLGDIRRLAHSCDFDTVVKSMIRDRIVVGVRDDTTRHKLLQIRDLTLTKAIDVCKASEAAGKQLKAMTNAEDVQAVATSKRRRNGMQSRGRNATDRGLPRRDKNDKNETRTTSCKYCG